MGSMKGFVWRSMYSPASQPYRKASRLACELPPVEAAVSTTRVVHPYGTPSFAVSLFDSTQSSVPNLRDVTLCELLM
jgi:hypothetical protein